MIKVETVIINGRELTRTYSDEGRYIISDSTGAQYEEAYDPAEFNRTYTEGDLIPGDDASPEEILDILLGGE